EALRKKLGGSWSGWDEQYVLDVNGEVLDPIGWVRQVYAKKDVVEGTQTLINAFVAAVMRLDPKPTKRHYHPDPTLAIEQAITRLNEFAADVPMAQLLGESRVLSYRLDPAEWPSVLTALD